MARTRTAVAVAAAAGLLAVGTAQAAIGQVGLAQGAPAHLVVANPGALTPGEQVLRAELSLLQYSVSVVDDAAAATADAGTALVLMAPSVDDAVLGTKYRNSPAPVIALGYGHWNTLGLTAGPGWSQSATTSLLVVDTTHPIAAGLPDEFAPANTTTDLQAVPESYLPASADPVAVRSGAVNAHVVYSMAVGAARSDGTATPANRVALGLTDPTLANLSDEGAQLLNNAIFWADGTLFAATTQSSNAAALSRKGLWKFDRFTSRYGTQVAGFQYTPSAEEPGTSPTMTRDDIKFFGGTTVSKAPRLVGSVGSALRFPGWKDATPANGVVDVNASAGYLADRNYLDAYDARLQVSVVVKPDNTANNDSLVNQTGNIVQKGRAEDPAQWKLSMQQTTRRAICTSKVNAIDEDPNTPRLEAGRELFSPDGVQLSVSEGTRFECEFEKGVLRQRLTNPGTPGVIHSDQKGQATAGYSIANGAQLFVGKKPDSTVAGDSFAGVMDQLEIWRAPLP